MIEIKLTFENEARKKVGLLSPLLLKNLDSAVQKAAFIVQGIAKAKISRGSRSGKVYRIYRGGKRPILHQASAPGEPPKTDTGRLVNSIRTNFKYLIAEVGSDVKYSSILELQKNRPWLRSSLDEAKEKVQSIVDLAIRGALD